MSLAPSSSLVEEGAGGHITVSTAELVALLANNSPRSDRWATSLAAQAAEKILGTDPRRGPGGLAGAAQLETHWDLARGLVSQLTPGVARLVPQYLADYFDQKQRKSRGYFPEVTQEAIMSVAQRVERKLGPSSLPISFQELKEMRQAYESMGWVGRKFQISKNWWGGVKALLDSTHRVTPQDGSVGFSIAGKRSNSKMPKIDGISEPTPKDVAKQFPTVEDALAGVMQPINGTKGKDAAQGSKVAR